MSEPYYADATVTVFHGDCLDVLRELPDASVDAVCTDPPYALNFMGSEWDSFAIKKRGQGGTGSKSEWAGGVILGASPEASNAFQAWCQLWAAECLRVLKPGGHLLAFGGTRTWHRLACAVEDAGFEVRDSIAWLYGSGFPKSLDVSKAIDRQRHDTDDKLRVTSWLAAVAERNGVTRADVDAHMGTSDMAGWWLSRLRHRCSIPTLEQVPPLLEVIGVKPDDVPDEIRALLIDLNGMKGQPGPAWFARTVIRERNRKATGRMMQGEGGYAFAEDFADTAPATPDAERWQGWGTALKPAWESVVVAAKPLPESARIGSRLDALEDECRRLANDAAKSSAPTRHASPGEKTATAPASAATPPEDEPARTTPTGAAAGSSAATDTSASESTAETCLSIVTSWKRCWAALSEATSTSTTETKSSTTTDLTTLWSCLSRLTQPSTLLDPTSRDGLSSLARAADSLFAAAVLSLNATRTLTATESATSPTPTPSRAGGALSPIVVARKPLAGTVAANVLAHGTGALNVDGCRVGTTRGVPASHSNTPTSIGATGVRPGEGRPDDQFNPNIGRWPANVVLDESQAATLDEQSGQRPGSNGLHGTYETNGRSGGVMGNPVPRVNDFAGYHDSGGASRFMYVAKADASERVRVNGTAHPTVKPLALMRWLVRLVTPPGGTVLEPFAGSGTTVEACLLEGFDCIAIEREADYLPLIRQRIHRRRDPVEAVRGSGEDGGLFDLLGEEPA